PLQTDIGQSGYLAIYSHQDNHFSHDERQLVEHLAANLGYALNTLRFQSERERQSEEIHNLAFSDALTGLPNRHYLVNYIENMLANTAGDDAPSAAILFIDLDGFKLINDVLGHEAGDQVLVQVARRLQNAIRDTDLVIRHGGDEFLVVLFDAPRDRPALTPADPGAFIRLCEELARRIINHIKEPIVICEQEHRINASIGISLCPDHGRDASSVIQAADNAMYNAKRSGGGCSHLYSPEILEKRHQRLSMEARLRHAISNDELVLHFQPMFRLEDLSTVGVEALARWPRADGSMIMPGDFIPVAEETGLIRPMGDWALAAGAQQLQSWHKQGYPLQ
ncbi:MAG: diguanylate cyclase, partial [Pseudohongiellaceae bacterium]